MKWLTLAAGIAVSALLVGCAVGPKYQRPPVQAPTEYKTKGPWRVAAPNDSLPKGAWWEIFNDGELNSYEQQLLKANQSLVAAQDRLNQARALARVASAGLFPQASTDANASRNRYSGHRPVVASLGRPLTQSTYEIPFLLSYEPDLFGKYRRTLEASNATLQATAADMYNVNLVLAAELDLAQQQTLLDSTVTQLYLVQQQRAQYEHAIAVLTGNAASTFSVPVAPLHTTPPPVPLGVPSDLLERRPDVATAERNMAFENAEVGVATAAFYPQLTIFGGGGVQSTNIANLISAPSAIWSLGGDLLQPIFQGGRNRANLAATKAAYDESVANYREAVLTAFQQVEDGLSGLNALSQAATSQNAAVSDARRALEIANHRYVGGVTTFLDVITAQSALLTNERLATQLLGQEMVTSVYLVKAVGGGWDASQIQNEQVRPKAIQAIQQ